MSLFTVEQLELIRRLRATGISPDQVLEAFRQLQSIDNDESLKDKSPAEPEVSASSPPVLLQALRSQPPVALTISASTTSPPSPVSIQTVPPPTTASEDVPPPTTAFPRYEHNAGGRPIRSQRTPMNDIVVLDNPAELDEFMAQGEEACIQDMKQFINQYSLRQTTVALMTGVSQPYISKLLNGNHRELSLRCRKNIYCWYLNCRRHPQKLASFLADPATRLETNPDGELVPQRRERYVFRPILIKMLEGFFAQTPFPDMNRRLEIANACNHVLELDKNGAGLMPKEVVSTQVIANWFANKRKELRRRSQESQEQQQVQQLSHHSSTNGEITGEETSSNIGSTPSPNLESGRQSHERSEECSLQPPIDLASLAARLGLTFPGLPPPKVDDFTATTLPISTLASQLLSQNLATTSPQPMVTLASQFLSNPQFTVANPLPLLPAGFPIVNGEMSPLAMAYEQLRPAMVKLEQLAER